MEKSMTNLLNKLKEVNKLQIYPIHEAAFLPYGNVLSGYDFKELCSVAEKETELPVNSTIYEPGCPAMESLQIANEIKSRLFGGMDIQIGYCNGQNSHLDALEYHKGSEAIIAVSPMVLLLATMTDMQDFSAFDSEKVKAFYMEAGEAVELYGTTLHYAPCKASAEGFRAIIILPKGTNFPLDDTKSPAKGEDQLLRMTNKWLIAHPNSSAAKEGAFAGISGENIEVKIT